MDVLEIMNQRHSTRMYTGEPLTESERVTISQLITMSISRPSTVSMELITDNDAQFDDRLDAVSYYGRFRNVPAYIQLAVPATAAGLREAGYAGESLILALTERGFDTCWAGGAVESAGRVISAESDEFDTVVSDGADNNAQFRIAIVIGHAARPGHAHKSKPINELVIGTDDGTAPDINTLPNWFIQGMEAVQLAPSALNRQNVRFAPVKDVAQTYTVRVADVGGLLAKVNTGVAMLHFERAVGQDVTFITE